MNLIYYMILIYVLLPGS